MREPAIEDSHEGLHRDDWGGIWRPDPTLEEDEECCSSPHRSNPWDTHAPLCVGSVLD